MSMEPTTVITAATYPQRTEMVAEVLALFNRDKQWYLDYFTRDHGGEPGRFLDVGLQHVPGDTWLVRYDMVERRIIHLWMEEKMDIGGMESWLKLVITIPTEIIPQTED